MWPCHDHLLTSRRRATQVASLMARLVRRNQNFRRSPMDSRMTFAPRATSHLGARFHSTFACGLGRFSKLRKGKVVHLPKGPRRPFAFPGLPREAALPPTNMEVQKGPFQEESSRSTGVCALPWSRWWDARWPRWTTDSNKGSESLRAGPCPAFESTSPPAVHVSSLV